LRFISVTFLICKISFYRLYFCLQTLTHRKKANRLKKSRGNLTFNLLRIQKGPTMNKPQDITELLRAWSSGDQAAANSLLPLVYQELHRQAVNYLRRERPDHTLQATALINEAYLKLIDQTRVTWQNRAHFFAIAAQAMRRIMVNHARDRHRDKRGGSEAVKLPLEEAALVVVNDQNAEEVVALDAALTRLAEFDIQQARVVELRYFSGLSLEETAAALGISRATVAREWSMAKAWLYHELTKR
jgi:RNA polymerase sigma factor (TIGR02999 family)